jgi:NAD(P)-dependent dehydrogenase (short-subunit alcohol dehydrogenase family)
MAVRNVVVFAATGAVGAAVAAAEAVAGTRLWLSARDLGKLEALAAELTARGARVEVARVDATDQGAVDRYVDGIAEAVRAQGERIDAGFNGIGLTAAEGGYPSRTADTDVAVFARPLDTILRSAFITTRALGRVMMAQGHGAIVLVTSALAGSQMPWMAGLTATSAAIEGLVRTLAAEFGVAGVRVNCVRADAMPETPSIARTGAAAEANGITREAFGRYVGLSLLGRPNSARQTAALISFLLSDVADAVTYQTFNAAARPLA